MRDVGTVPVLGRLPRPIGRYPPAGVAMYPCRAETLTGPRWVENAGSGPRNNMA